MIKPSAFEAPQLYHITLNPFPNKPGFYVSAVQAF